MSLWLLLLLALGLLAPAPPAVAAPPPAEPGPSAQPQSAASEAPVDGFRWEQNDETLEFSYSWPNEAESVVELRTWLQRDLDAEFTRAAEYVEESQAAARENGIEFHPHHFDQDWSTAGTSEALVSLSASVETFTGGAHGNQRFASMLWDMRRGQALEVPALLGADALRRLTPRYCAALDAERLEIRGEPTPRDDMFGDCPPLREQVLVVVDSDGNHRFDRLRVLMGPYVAGPYVEGSYAVELPLQAADLAGLPPAYRAEFAAAD